MIASQFVANAAGDGDAGGGAISASDLHVVDSAFTGNRGDGRGGAILASTIDVTGSTFSLNHALGGGETRGQRILVEAVAAIASAEPGAAPALQMRQLDLCGERVLVELDARRLQDVRQLLFRRCAGDRGRDRRLMQQPGDGNIRWVFIARGTP